MKGKKASLVINPRGGANIAKLPDVLAIFAAADWRTDLTLKEYGSQAMELAARATEAGSDLVIAYGGDGTLNQVINGVMDTKGQNSIVGLIPGGTANVWATEMGIPNDPVKAALMLINSDVRSVDIGHVQVEGIAFRSETQEKRILHDKQKRWKKDSTTLRTHFLLMAGLGIDAAVMEHVSKASKYQIGPLAVGISAAEELPKQRPFPVEIRGSDENVLWKGEALQVVIGNTRRYAEILEMTPEAYIDDGVLDICVITAGDPLTTLEQIASLLLRRKPDTLTAEFFHAAHFSISVPVSIALQLDGSIVKLKDFLCKSERQALAHVDHAENVLVTYRFDAIPHTLQIAIPHDYNDALFKRSDSADPQPAQTTQASEEQQREQEKQQEEDQPERQQHNGQQFEPERQQALEHVKALLTHGRMVKVIGVSRNLAQKEGYIVAGSVIKPETGEVRPIAVCIEKGVTVRRQTGEETSATAVSQLQEGETIVVEGKKSKRGVLRARHIII